MAIDSIARSKSNGAREQPLLQFFFFSLTYDHPMKLLQFDYHKLNPSKLEAEDKKTF